MPILASVDVGCRNCGLRTTATNTTQISVQYIAAFGWCVSSWGLINSQCFPCLPHCFVDALRGCLLADVVFSASVHQITPFLSVISRTCLLCYLYQIIRTRQLFKRRSSLTRVCVGMTTSSFRWTPEFRCGRALHAETAYRSGQAQGGSSKYIHYRRYCVQAVMRWRRSHAWPAPPPCHQLPRWRS